MNLLTYVVGRSMAVSQNIDTSDANKIGLVASLPNSSILGIVLASAMIRNDQEVLTTNTSGSGGSGLYNPPGIPGNLQVDKVPHLHGFTGEQVKLLARDMGFHVLFDKNGSDLKLMVDEQWPAAGRPMPENNTIKISLKSPSS